jgi:hypothetical protein
MAHILPNGTWRVLIRRHGHPTIDQVFESQGEAEAFERDKKTELDGAKALWSPSMTLAQAARQYQRSTLFTGKTPRTQSTERTRLNAVLAELGEYSLEQLENGQRIVAFRDKRVSRVSEKTGSFEIRVG